jgi:hypothetical protein
MIRKKPSRQPAPGRRPGADAESLPWTRLPHEDLGMPAPAVYLPQRTVPADTRGMWGFEPLVTRDAGKPIPYAHRGELALAADIRAPGGMEMLIVPSGVFTGTGVTVQVDDPQVFATGHFTDPHPLAWREAAYAAGSLLAVIGPQDVPGLDPAQLQEGPAAALDELWLFKAAIAVVYLVTPGAAHGSG